MGSVLDDKVVRVTGWKPYDYDPFMRAVLCLKVGMN
jgi:hypothetical protein